MVLLQVPLGRCEAKDNTQGNKLNHAIPSTQLSKMLKVESRGIVAVTYPPGKLLSVGQYMGSNLPTTRTLLTKKHDLPFNIYTIPIQYQHNTPNLIPSNTRQRNEPSYEINLISIRIFAVRIPNKNLSLSLTFWPSRIHYYYF